MRIKMSIRILGLAFVIALLLGIFQTMETSALEDGSEDKQSSNHVVSSEKIKYLVVDLEDEGGIKSSSAAYSLKLHLMAVERFEEQEATNKVIKHMKGFKQLLGYQYENELLTKQAYNELDSNADALIEQWNSLPIVRDGQANAVVIIAEDANEKMNEAANTLIEYVRKSTEAELPIITSDKLDQEAEEYDGYTFLYIGMNAPNREEHVNAELEDLHDEGFLIHPHEDNVIIIGPTVWGTLNGVYEFLESYVDVRWLLQGEEFEDVPASTDLFITKDDVREEPAFNYRRIKPFASAEQPFGKWLQRNRLQTNENDVISRAHNLYNLFPPEKYGETHPEFYKDGKPPKENNSHAPSPCFTAEGIVDVAVTEIIAYFDQNPDEKSISLAVNDGAYCEADESHPAYPDKFNSIGRVDLSDIYYEWVNAVVEGVLEVYPDKWFGVLAYSNVMDPPSFSVHPRVVPFYTKDRNTWIDDVRNKSQQFIEDWTEVADQMGLYDYPYGPYYDLPRVYPRLMAENYKYDKQHNIFGIEHEMYPTVIDGPKSWIAAKLMWDPDQDVEDLLEEWYERAVGPAAAEDLAVFYDFWEQFWMERIKGSEWFERGKELTMLPFRDPAYMDLVTDEEIEESKRQLDLVLSKVETDQQRARVEMLQRAFEYIEASALSNPREIDSPQSEAAALDILDHVENTMESRVQFAQKRQDLYEAFQGIPGLDMHLVVGRASPYRSGWNQHELWGIVEYISNHEMNGGPVSDKVNELATNAVFSGVRDFAKVLQTTVSSGENKLFTLTKNASFEEGGENVPSWSTSWIRDSGSMSRVEGISRTGNASLLIDNLGSGGPTQYVPITPGLATAQVFYYTPEGTETDGTINLMVYSVNENGEKLRPVKSARKLLSNTVGEWASIEILEAFPETIDGVKIDRMQLVVEISGRDTQIYLDDGVIYQAMDELITPQTFWSLADEISENEEDGGLLRQQVVQIAGNEEPSEERDFARLLLDVIDGTATSLTENSSFEEIKEDGFAQGWEKWNPSAGTIERVAGISHSGDASLRIKGLTNGGPTRDNIAVEPGPFALRVYTHIPPGKGTDTRIRLTLKLRGPNTSIVLPTQAVSDESGWVPVDLAGVIPEDVEGVKVKHAQLVVGFYQDDETDEVYLDDAALYQLQE